MVDGDSSKKKKSKIIYDPSRKTNKKSLLDIEAIIRKSQEGLDSPKDSDLSGGDYDYHTYLE
jgi:hypothetical protein